MSLPPGWASTTLGDVVEVLDRFRVPVKGTERANRQGHIFYYGATGQVGWIDDYLFDEELILLGEDGAPFLDSSKPKSYLIRGKSWVNNHAHVLRGSGGVSNAFLMHQLNVLDYGPYVSGTTRLKLPQAPMVRIPIRIAPLAEQQRIVAEIEKHLTRLDAAVGALQRLRAHLKRYRASVLKAAMERKLVPKEGPWRLLAVSDFAEVQGGIQKQPKRAPVKNAFPYLRVANVLRGRLDLTEVHQMELFGGELDRLRLRVGDLLVVEGNGSPSEIGRMARWSGEIDDCVHQNHIIRVRCGTEAMPEFIETYWNSPSGAEAVRKVSSSTSGLNTLSVSKVSNIQVPLPSISEQERIVTEVERRLSVLDSFEATVENAFKRAGRLRQSVLKRAFEGRLVPQVPDDEPASVLLERIQTARAKGGRATTRNVRYRTARQVMLGESAAE